MTNWFGESWGAPVNSDCPRCVVPVGSACARCHIVFCEDDQGFVLPGPVAFHKDCMLKAVVPHERWERMGLVPAVGDGFVRTVVDGEEFLLCEHCGIRYYPAMDAWFSSIKT